MYAPIIRSAQVVRRYRAGAHQAVLFEEVDAEGPVGYEYIVAVFEPGVRDPGLFVTSERNDPEAAADLMREMGLEPEEPDPTQGSHFLCVFDERGHHNFGHSDDWGDLAKFEEAALRVLADRLGAAPEVEQG